MCECPFWEECDKFPATANVKITGGVEWFNRTRLVVSREDCFWGFGKPEEYDDITKDYCEMFCSDHNTDEPVWEVLWKPSSSRKPGSVYRKEGGVSPVGNYVYQPEESNDGGIGEGTSLSVSF